MEINIRNPLFESKNLLAASRFGSPKTRREHERVIRRAIKDLFLCGIFFDSFRNIKIENIEKLINHWRLKTLSDGTISNRLMILKKYLSLVNSNLKLPDNEKLGLKPRIRNNNEKNIDVFAYYENYKSKFFNPITRLTIDLQVWFGVTRLEALRLSPHMTTDENPTLFLPRSITRNHKDRLVVIYCDKQKKILLELKEVLKNSPSLIEKYKKKIIYDLYEGEHMINKYDEKAEYRQLFAVNFYHYSVNHLKMDNKTAIDSVSQQIGMTRKTTILQWIRNEKKRVA